MNKAEKKSLEYLKSQLKKKEYLSPIESLFLAKNPDFDKKPCFDFDEFIDNQYYLGIGEDTYQRIKEEGRKVWEGLLGEKYTEGICLWGIGAGKSFLAELLSLIFVHYLLCMKNPHKAYGLTNDKPIAVVNMGTTATQAKNVIFAGMRKLIEASPFFLNEKPEVLQTEIRFPKKNITLYCGNSQETMPIGMNVIFGSLDEAAWYLDNDNKSVAENIYNTMKNRIVSRFGDSGFVFIISAPRYVDDFISRKFSQAQELDYIYATSFKTWEVKDKDKMKEETFTFEVNEAEKWEVPVDFEKVAKVNPEKFMRDFGAKPSLVLEAFDRDSAVVERNINTERESPIDEIGRYKEWFIGDEKERYVHIDLALSRDACGFAMGCIEKQGEGDELPQVKIDLMERIEAPIDGEINFESIRQKVYSLKERGFRIQRVTFDQFQSADTMQILRKKGIDAELLSVDRTVEPYNTLKSLLHVNRLNYYSFEPFLAEYKRLELIKGKKVDHPQGGSKDVTDAVAGVVHQLVSKTETKGFLDYMRKEGQQERKPRSNLEAWKKIYEKL